MVSNYEHIGSMLYQMTKRARDLEEKTRLERFIRKYTETPLFLVGLDEDGVKDIRNKVRDEEQEEFHLPFPSILLDFPEATFLVDDGFVERPLIYVSEVMPPVMYYAEVMCDPRGATLKKFKEVAKDKEIREGVGDNMMGMVDNFLNGVDCGGKADFLPVMIWSSFVFMPMRVEGDLVPIIPNMELRMRVRGCEYDSDAFPDVDKIIGSVPFMTCKPCGEEECRGNADMAFSYADLIMSTVHYINMPQSYVIKESELLTPREQKLKDKKSQPFFMKKPRHIVLDHSQVKEIIQYSHDNSGHGTPKMPHERIGHWRNLRAERFKEKKKVWVRSSEINAGMKWAVGHRTYEVIR